MLLYHPELSDVSCSDCKTWIYDRNWKKVNRRGSDEPQRRKPHQPTPCSTCPRKSPENERFCVLNKANSETLMLFMASRGGASLTPEESSDEIIRRNFAMLQLIYDGWNQRSSAEEISKTLMMSGVVMKDNR